VPEPTPPTPDGTYLVWGGRTWTGAVRSPTTAVLLSREPEEGFTPRNPGRGYQREVPLSEVQVFRLTTTATWRGRRFQVLGRTADQVHLGYLGHDQQEAESLGLTEREPRVFTTTVPAAEVSEQTQERTPA